MCWALKHLHDVSRAPHVYSSTLPQYRLDNGQIPRPQQDEYPVWYFLTGELTRGERLKQLLKLNRLPYMRVASIDGLVQAHERQCNALVAPRIQQVWCSQDFSEGMAYRVQNEEEERRLRYFKTAYFCVVRCTITLSAKGTFGSPSKVDGLAFIYSGGEAMLRYMNSFPIASTPGAICSRRSSKASHRPPPITITPKTAPTTAVTILSVSAVSTISETNPQVVRWQPPFDPPPSYAAQGRHLASLGWRSKVMEDSGVHTIPKPGYAIPISKAIAASTKPRATEKSMGRAWWRRNRKRRRVSISFADRQTEGVETTGTDGPIDYTSNAEPNTIDIDLPDYGMAGPAQHETSSKPASIGITEPCGMEGDSTSTDVSLQGM